MKNRTLKIAEIFLITSLPVALLVACNTNGETQASTQNGLQAEIMSKTTNTLTSNENQSVIVASDNTLSAVVEHSASTDSTESTSSLEAVIAKVDPVPKPTHQIIFFAANRYYIPEKDRAQLKEHAQYLRYNPDTTLLITGFSDSAGPADINYALSKKRAENVRDALLDEGVSEVQLRVYAYGEAFALKEANKRYNDRRES